MKRSNFIISLVIGAAMTMPVATAFAGVISNVQVNPFTISPNGDGVSDSTVITVDLADTVSAVHVLILEKDLITVVDSLVKGIPRGAGSFTTSWDGTDSGGMTVAEDSFFVFVRTTGLQPADSVTLKVKVDLTPPRVLITNVDPNDFAPGIDPKQRIFFDVTDAPPSDFVRVTAQILQLPGRQVVHTFLDDSLVTPNSSLMVVWDGTSSSADGIHEFFVSVTDQANHNDTAFRNLNIDNADPDLTFTTTNSQRVTVVPDSVRGWAWDRNGIALIKAKYPPSQSVSQPVTNTFTRDDTVFFALPLADSVTTTGVFTIVFDVEDSFGRDTRDFFEVTWDTVPPPPPILDPIETPTRNQFVTLTGTGDPGVFTRQIRFYRNGTLLDSIQNGDPQFFDNERFRYNLALIPGVNIIWADQVDNLGNVSSLSNTVRIEFDGTVGFFINQPFRSNDAFQINLVSPATAISINVYDMSGGLVQKLYASMGGTSISIPWDGNNGDGEPVRKGPLIAVLVVEYTSSNRNIQREAFLFDPQ